MSHFTRVKTKMQVRDYIVAALTDLGFEFQVGSLRVRDYTGRRTRVQIRVPTAFRGYSIGIAKRGSGYEVVADWWGIRGIDQDTFIRNLTRRYAYHAARAELEKQGFSLAGEEVEEDGRLHLTLRRAV